jgi:hypothetical protein
VTAFVERALAWFGGHGINCRRLQTDNASSTSRTAHSASSWPNQPPGVRKTEGVVSPGHDFPGTGFTNATGSAPLGTPFASRRTG